MTQELHQMIQMYLNRCKLQKNLDIKTIKAYGIDLHQFVAFIGDNESPLDKATITIYINHIHRLYKPKTVKRKIASLKAFVNYLEFEELIGQNPFTRLDIRFREPQQLPRTIPLHIIKKFISTLYGQNQAKMTPLQRKTLLRDIAVIELLFVTGVRISELCSLRPAQVDLINCSILVQGKGAKERLIQIGNLDVVKILQSYATEYADDISQSNWFFTNRLGNRLSEQSVRNMIRRYVTLANINIHITPHQFRHSFATLLLEADVDIRYIQKMLGHSSITTTQIYTFVTMEKQKEILIEKHPRNSIVINKLHGVTYDYCKV